MTGIEIRTVTFVPFAKDEFVDIGGGELHC
jgi:hypothetical protein